MAYAIRLCQSLCIDNHKHGTVIRIMLCDGVILHVQSDNPWYDILYSSEQLITNFGDNDMQFGNEQKNNNKDGVLHDIDKYSNASNI